MGCPTDERDSPAWVEHEAARLRQVGQSGTDAELLKEALELLREFSDAAEHLPEERERLTAEAIVRTDALLGRDTLET